MYTKKMNAMEPRTSGGIVLLEDKIKVLMYKRVTKEYMEVLNRIKNRSDVVSVDYVVEGFARECLVRLAHNWKANLFGDENHRFYQEVERQAFTRLCGELSKFLHPDNVRFLESYNLIG